MNKGSHSFRALLYAGVAEQADARDLKSLDRNIIRVQIPSVAPRTTNPLSTAAR